MLQNFLAIVLGFAKKPGLCTLRFSIKDTGVGMTPQQIEKIFLPFEQVGNPKKQSEGTGLGLAISHEIAALMNSEIKVESALGEGSIFSFEMELPEAENWANASSSVQQRSIAGYTGEKRKILVVGDRWGNRSVLANLLEPLGFEMIEAQNGQEGIELTLNTSPDLIVIDLTMSVMDGFEFLQRLRSHPKIQHHTVLVSSGSVSEIDRHKSIDAGGDDFLPKPVQAETLFDLLQKHLNLDWILHDYTDERSPSHASSETILPPAMAVLSQLSELARLGDIDGVLEMAQQLQQPDTTIFAQELIRLGEACEIRKLRAFIRQYLV